MPNAWVEHVRKFAAKNGMSYGCAVSDAECKAKYHRQKARNAKMTRTPAQEMEGMGAEDVNVAEKPKKKKSMPSDVGKLIQDFARPKAKAPAKAEETKAKRIKKVMNLTSSNQFWKGGKDYYYPSVIDKKNNTAYGIVDGKVMIIGKVFEDEYDDHKLYIRDEPKPVASNLRFYSAGEGILRQGRGKPIEALNKLQ